MTAETPVVVLLGGPSAEHDVSIVSGTAIAAALAEEGYLVEQVVIDLEGAWWWLPTGHRRGDRAPAARVWLTPRDQAELAELSEGSPYLLLFYLFDWSST